MFFKMHTDMTAVTVQSNKIVSSEVKDNQALREPSYRKKKKELFGQPSRKVTIVNYVWIMSLKKADFGEGESLSEIHAVTRKTPTPHHLPLSFLFHQKVGDAKTH